MVDNEELKVPGRTGQGTSLTPHENELLEESMKENDELFKKLAKL